MQIKIRKATLMDAQLIAKARVELLNEASGPLSDEEKNELFLSNRAYISKGLANLTLITFLAFDAENFVGTCSATLYSLLPGKKLPDGRQAYVQNMYIVPEYRRKGLGRKLLSAVVEEAAKLGHTRVSLHATDMGKELFKSFGFANESVALAHMVYDGKDK
jgi:GNAT superfamily N-acetyltransferase